MPEAAPAVEVKAPPPPVVSDGDVPSFIKNAETFPPKLQEPDSQKETAKAPVAEAPKKEDAPKEAVETPETEKPKPGKTSYERRLDRVIKREAEARQKAEYLERQNAELQQKLQPPKEPVGAPRMEDFTDIQQYAEKYAEWKSGEALKAHETKQREAQTRQAQQALATEWEAKVLKGTTKYDDFEDVVGELKPVTPWARAIMRAENGHDIAHHLANHREEVMRIAGLDAEAQVLEVATLGAKLAAKPVEAKKPPSAPAPITPVSGAAVPEQGIRDGMSFEEFRKVRNKQLGRSK